MSSKLFFGGVPTDPDIHQLRKSFPTPEARNWRTPRQAQKENASAK